MGVRTYPRMGQHLPRSQPRMLTAAGGKGLWHSPGAPLASLFGQTKPPRSHLQAKPFLSHYFIPPTLMWWILEGDLSAKLSESYSCGLAAAACCPPWLRQCLTKARPSPADVSRAARLLLPVEQERCGYPAHGTRHHPLLRDLNTPSTEPSAHGLGSLTRSRGTGRGARRIPWGHSARGPSPR